MSGPGCRDLLKRLAVGGAAAAAATVVPRAAVPTGSPARAVTVFRLRTRDTQSCKSCRSHHRYKVFISLASADRNRAHPGCNCPITKQKLGKEAFNRLFLDTKAIRDGFVDLRRIPR